MDLSSNTIFRLTVGLIDRVCPVQAKRARLTSIQSIEPSIRITARELMVALVDTSAVTGLVEDNLW